MSHNVSVTDVEFRDLAVLEQAVKELLTESNQQGALLAEGNKGFRAYGRRVTRADVVISLPGEQYDIGLNKQAGGAYVPIYESGFSPRAFSTRHTAQSLDENARADYHKQGIGRLVQRYSVIMAERNARRAGLQTRRMVDTAKGQIRLEVN